MASSNFPPPRENNLIPLSGIGLCDAEIITPRSAPDSATRCAIAGVGRTPTRKTSTPALVKPATTAASRNSPDARESWPTTAFGRCDLSGFVSTRICAAATATSSANSAVKSRLAKPRIPSVPKSATLGRL